VRPGVRESRPAKEAVDAATYDAWYRTPRGAWIGDVEHALLARVLRVEPGERLLDVGCGTGYFTRRFAGGPGPRAVGVDPDLSAVAFARAHATGAESYCGGRAEALPFRDASFDRVVSVTALCFVADPRRALCEMLRVARRRFAIGLLNRHSLLYRQKGRAGGMGAYRGAHWHTATEVRALFAGLPVSGLRLRYAVFAAGGGRLARAIERCVPDRVPLGAFIVATGDVVARP
jgi:SAM-dependent methyltransferase